MAYLVQPDYVKYLCSCGQVKPITNLYFCRHCLKIRCSFCICHEVDSHYCPQCLENMPSSEARLKKNRCSSCFACPICFHALSTRATTGQQRQAQPQEPAAGDGMVENKQLKKMYYLLCFNCRWTSRDAGIPDQPVASGGWPERTNPLTSRFNQLLDYYKAIVQQEKQEKKYSSRGKYITLTDKTGLTGAMARNLAGFPSLDAAPSALAAFSPSVAVEHVEPLPEDIYTKEVDLKSITSMPQRLACPDRQPVTTDRVVLLQRPLCVKRSQRCRVCDHNLTKPDYSPTSIKFKIELLAYYHVPELKIISLEPLKVGGQSSLMLKVTNPTSYEMTFRLMNNEDVKLTDDDEEKNGCEEAKELVWTKSTQSSPLRGNTSLRCADVKLSLSQRDDAAEYDDDCGNAAPQHEMIVWRKSNKMALRIAVEVPSDFEKRSVAKLVFAIEYSYRNTVPPSATQPRTPQDHTLYAIVALDLGIVES